MDIEKIEKLKADINKVGRTIFDPAKTEKFAKGDPRSAWARREQDEKISALHQVEKAMRGF